MSPNSEMPLREFFDEVYRPRRLRGCVSNTVGKYKSICRKFGECLGREALLSDLTEDQVAIFISLYSQNNRPDTVRSTQSKLLALANYAVKKGLLKEVPDLMPIHPPRQIPIAYTAEEIGQLLATARTWPGETDGIPCRLFWPALFLVAYDTGARKGAIFALGWQHFRPDDSTLLFRAETQKQNADQLLKVSSETVAAIEAIRKPEREKLFPWTLHEGTFYYRLKNIFKAAGLPNGRRDLLHRIRRTTATLMHRNGGDACTQLGHSTDAVTRKHYLDTSHIIQAADVLPRPGTNGNGQLCQTHNPVASELRKQAEALLKLAASIEARPAA